MSTTPRMLLSMRAAVYVRQSEDKTGEEEGVERQLALCTDMIQRNGWTLAETYSDNDTSATKNKPRPGWKRLLTDLDAGLYDVLVCQHTDRLYRRLRDVADLLEVAERNALRIAAVRAGDLDLSTPAGRYFAGQLAGMARFEMETKAGRQMDANRRRAQKGVSIWTRRPFGFDRDGRDVFIVEAEAEVIRDAAQRVLSGATTASVVRDLNEQGSTTTLGKPWSVTSLRRVLVNPRIAGRLRYRGEDMGPGSWPSILDADTFDRLVATLTDPRRKTAPNTTVKHLLSGLAICGTCETPMYATVTRARHGAREKYHVYQCRQCRRTRKLDHTDEYVVGVIVGRLARPDAALLFAADVDLDAKREQVDELRNRRDGLAAMLAEGLLSPDAVREQAKRLNDRIGVLEREIRAAESDSPLTGLVGADDVAAVWDSLPVLRKRDVIRTLCEVHILAIGRGARFDPEAIDIRWRAAA